MTVTKGIARIGELINAMQTSLIPYCHSVQYGIAVTMNQFLILLVKEKIKKRK